MKRHTVLSFFTAALLVGGCGDDFTNSGSNKVDSDEQEMTLDPDGDGVAEGQEQGELASMDFELGEPLPEISGAEPGEDAHRAFDATQDLALESIAESLDVSVSSPRSGVSVSLTADGMLVPAPPSAPGEWSVTLSDDRRDISLQWYNEVGGGARIEAGQSYDVVYSLGSNCCLASVSETAIEFTLGG